MTIALQGVPSTPTSLLQEFRDCFGPQYEHLTHEQWVGDVQDYPGRYAYVFGWTEQEINMLKSMKPGLTQVTKDEKLWTYAGVVRMQDGANPEPHFLFSTNPHNVHPFSARDVLDCLKAEVAGGEGVKFMKEHPLDGFGD